MREPLAARLRAETKAGHVEAERSGIMRSILRGRVERRAYCELLRGLHEVYAALEAGLVRHAAHPVVGPVHVAELRRESALAADLHALHGPGWRHELPVRATAAAYAARLRRLADEQPALLVAHAYVRYLGDLSGGQLLRSLVTQALALASAAPAGNAGVSFYDFGGPNDVAALKARFRAALNSLPVDDEAADRITDEAKLAFGLHARLFEELELSEAAAAATASATEPPTTGGGGRETTPTGAGLAP
jgi:heme oxygenase (biliverdin-producing, ferredoxin)